MYVLLRAGDPSVGRTVWIRADHTAGAAGWINNILRYRAKRDGVPDFRIQVGPLHGVADVNRDRAVDKAHQGKRLLSAGAGCDLANACGDRHGPRKNPSGEQISDRVLMFCVLLTEIRVFE